MRKLLFITFLLLSSTCYAGNIAEPPVDTSLTTETRNYIQNLYNNINNLLVVTSNPNGSRVGKKGDLVVYNNSGSFSLNVCTSAPTGTAWSIVSGSSISFPLSTSLGGTGTSASANSANGVVILDGSGKLPALDGSQLTNLPFVDTNTSNTVFSYGGKTDTYANSLWVGSGTTYATVLNSKFKKISGISTVTVYAYAGWDTDGAGRCRITIGSATPLELSFAGTDSTLTWSFGSIDVSGLSNGSVYDLTFDLKSTAVGGNVKLGSIIGFGS